MTTDMNVYHWSCPHGSLLCLHRTIAVKLSTLQWSAGGVRLSRPLNRHLKTSSGLNWSLRALPTLRRAAPSTDHAQSTDQGVCLRKEDQHPTGQAELIAWATDLLRIRTPNIHPRNLPLPSLEDVLPLAALALSIPRQGPQSRW
jgi:hypothetical protein